LLRLTVLEQVLLEPSFVIVRSMFEPRFGLLCSAQ